MATYIPLWSYYGQKSLYAHLLEDHKIPLHALNLCTPGAGLDLLHDHLHQLSGRDDAEGLNLRARLQCVNHALAGNAYYS